MSGGLYWDRVQETSTTTGTGTITLLGAVAGFQAFSAVVPTGTQVYYTITDNTSNWEVGYGVYTLGGTTLSRLKVLESSNANALVNFPAGTYFVFITQPAETVADIAMTIAVRSLTVPQ